MCSVKKGEFVFFIALFNILMVMVVTFTIFLYIILVRKRYTFVKRIKNGYYSVIDV